MKDGVSFWMEDGTLFFQHICGEQELYYSLVPAIYEITADEGGVTVAPKVQCNNCGLMGKITNGKWIAL